jgi:HlyD family secretion protein
VTASAFLRRKWILSLAIIALLAAGGVWFYYSRYLPAQAAPPKETIRTAQVTQGDLVISASGSGELLPATEASLGFQSGDLLAQVLVHPGDQVNAGDVLARQDDADARYQVAQAEISLRQVELQLAQLNAGPTAAELASARAGLASAEADLDKLTALATAEETAAAQVSLASAQADLDKLTTPASAEDLSAAHNNLLSAQAALTELQAGPSEPEVILLKADLEKAEISLRQAQADYDGFAWRQGYESSPQAANLQQATIDHARAKANYELASEGPTGEALAAAWAKVAQAQAALDVLEQGPDTEHLAAAQAKLAQAEAQVAALELGADAGDLASAQAKVAQAQAQLNELLAGPSAEDLESAQLNVEQARNSLAVAESRLANTQLRAPFAGIVTAVDASAGESVGTTPFVTLVDLEAPLVRFWVEEADLASVVVGNQVNIIFEALPDDTFTGEVIRVEPALVVVDGTPAVQSWASVDLSANPVRLLSGMTVGEVEVVAAEARNVLLVPVQALRELRQGQYAVFVAGPGGELQLRPVEVGLKDLVNAGILSGLELGEDVSTGAASGSGGSFQPPGGGAPMPGGDMMMRRLGG